MSARTNIALVILTLLSAPANARDQSDCQGALIQNTKNVQHDVAQNLAILHTIKKSDFEQAKRSLDMSGSSLIGGIPLTSAMSWDQFDEKRQQYFSEYRSDFSLQDNLSWNEVYLAPAAAQAYSECLRSLRPVGTHMWAVESRPGSDIVTVRVAFYTDGNDPQKRTLSVNKIGGTVEIDDFQRQLMVDFQGPKEFDILFQRSDVKKDARLVVSVSNTNQGNASLTIPRDPTIFKSVVERKGYMTSRDVSVIHSNEQSPGELCFPATPTDFEQIAGYLLVPSTVAATREVLSGEGDESIGISKTETDQVCAHYNVGGDSWGHGRAVRFTLSVAGERRIWKPYASQE